MLQSVNEIYRIYKRIKILEEYFNAEWERRGLSIFISLLCETVNKDILAWNIFTQQ